MKNRVITISREFGSGGRTIGKKVAEKLGIPCYDAEIIQEMAKETGFAPDYVQEAGEYAPAASCPPPFPIECLAPPMRTFCGSASIRSSQSLPQKAPASSWDAALTTFCRTRQAA